MIQPLAFHIPGGHIASITFLRKLLDKVQMNVKAMQISFKAWNF